MAEFALILALMFLYGMFKLSMDIAESALKNSKNPAANVCALIIMFIGLFYGVCFLALAISALAHWFNEINILLNVLPIQKL